MTTPRANPLVQPTPTQWDFGIAQAPDGSNKMVAIVLHMVTGTHQIFITADSARGLAANLVNQADLVEQPTLLAPARSLIGPDGRPIFFANPNGHVPPPPAPGEPVGPAIEQIADEAAGEEHDADSS